ncbi:MAG: ABC transporter permease [Methanomassiliicoccus sp.]|nr:ABC transporter permease [Methanomassiliicoccus sp.]
MNEVFDRPPSDGQQVMTVTYYELYKYVRSARMVGILALAALIVALILVIPPALGQEYPKDPAYFAQRFFLWSSVLIVVGATLFAGDSLASEFQSRTGYLMFPNPVKRWVYFTGKLLASLITMFLVLSVFYIVVSLLTIGHSQTFSDLTYRSFGLSLLYIVAAVGVGYLVSAVMKGATGALVFTFAILFLIFPILDGVLSFAGAKPAFSVTFSAQAISYIMQTPYPTDQQLTLPTGGAFGGGGAAGSTVEVWNYYPDVGTAALVMIIYAVITIAAALVIFQRRDMAA